DRGTFSTPCMTALGVRAVDCTLNEIRYPLDVVQQERISALIVAAEAKALKRKTKSAKGAEVVCARPSCRNRFTPRRRDQHTCGTARCRQWRSRQQRTKNLTVARRRGPSGGDARNRENGPGKTGPGEGHWCTSG